MTAGKYQNDVNSQRKVCVCCFECNNNNKSEKSKTEKERVEL